MNYDDVSDDVIRDRYGRLLDLELKAWFAGCLSRGVEFLINGTEFNNASTRYFLDSEGLDHLYGPCNANIDAEDGGDARLFNDLGTKLIREIGNYLSTLIHLVEVLPDDLPWKSEHRRKVRQNVFKLRDAVPSLRSFLSVDGLGNREIREELMEIELNLVVFCQYVESLRLTTQIEMESMYPHLEAIPVREERISEETRQAKPRTTRQSLTRTQREIVLAAIALTRGEDTAWNGERPSLRQISKLAKSSASTVSECFAKLCNGEREPLKNSSAEEIPILLARLASSI